MKLKLTLSCAAFVLAILGTFASSLLKSESFRDPDFYYEHTTQSCEEIPTLECDDICPRICTYKPPSYPGYVVAHAEKGDGETSICARIRCNSRGPLN